MDLVSWRAQLEYLSTPAIEEKVRVMCEKNAII